MLYDIINPTDIPEELEELPEAYFQTAKNQGRLEALTYNTYDSNTYEQKITPLQKRAIVYLPYGYNESTEYNIFYFMHGGGGNEETQLGTPENPTSHWQQINQR